MNLNHELTIKYYEVLRANKQWLRSTVLHSGMICAMIIVLPAVSGDKPHVYGVHTNVSNLGSFVERPPQLSSGEECVENVPVLTKRRIEKVYVD